MSKLEQLASAYRSSWGAQERNVMFGLWVTQLLSDIATAGLANPSVEVIPGGRNAYYVLPDGAWLSVEGFYIFCPQAIVSLVDDPVAWVKTQVSNQKAFGRIAKT